MTVTVYTKPDCPLCEEAKEVLGRVRRRVPFDLEEINIVTDAALFERFRYDIPVVFIDGQKAFKHHLDEATVEHRLRRAAQMA